MAFVVGFASLTASPSLGMPLAVCLRQRARGCALVIRCRSFLGPAARLARRPCPRPWLGPLRLALLAAHALALGSGLRLALLAASCPRPRLGLAARLARRPCPRPRLGPCGSPCSPPRALALGSGLAARLARRPCPRPWLGSCGSPCSPPMPSPLARALRLALLAAPGPRPLFFISVPSTARDLPFCRL